MTSSPPKSEEARQAQEPPSSPRVDGDDGAAQEKKTLKQSDGTSEDGDAPSDLESGECEDSDERPLDSASGKAPATTDAAAPPLPDEAVVEGPPLPNEPLPPPGDDGWDCQWDPNTQAWFFYNRFTGQSQWDNPRVPSETSGAGQAPGTSAAAAAPGAASGAAASAPLPPLSEQPPAGGYNPAIHGDYDPEAWYAKGSSSSTSGPGEVHPAEPSPADLSQMYASAASFNRYTGQFQAADASGAHTDEAKSRRQMNAFFDVDAAANAHGGRSLKAERSNKKPNKTEVKAFKEKRRARKEEKRRAWLRD